MLTQNIYIDIYISNTLKNPAMEKSNQTNIVLGADDNYALPLAVTLCSILKNVPSTAALHFFILDGGITKKSKKKIAQRL